MVLRAPRPDQRIATVPFSGPTYRLSDALFDSPLHFGKSADTRFGLPEGPGVLYLAEDVPTAFAETFGHGVAATTSLDDRVLEQAELTSRKLWQVDASELELADCAGNGLQVMGIDAQIFADPDYTTAQQWSQLFADRELDGILYLSRHRPRGTCLALFEWANPLLSVVDLGPFAAWRDGADSALTVCHDLGWAVL